MTDNEKEEIEKLCEAIRQDMKEAYSEPLFNMIFGINTQGEQKND